MDQRLKLFIAIGNGLRGKSHVGITLAHSEEEARTFFDVSQQSFKDRNPVGSPLRIVNEDALGDYVVQELSRVHGPNGREYQVRLDP